MPFYGDDQSQYTMNRGAYGDIPAAMMMGGGGMGGPSYPNQLSGIGGPIMPVGYYAPMRVNVGYYGMYQQHMTMMRGLAMMAGLGAVPRGTTAMEYGVYGAGDFGERMAGGTVGTGLAVGGILAGTAAASYTTPMGVAAGAALGSVFGPVGTAIGAGAGWLAGNLGGYAIGGAIAGNIQSSIGARRNIENFLESSSFRFVGAGTDMSDPRLGGGMSRTARQEAANFIRETERTDPYMNNRDLTQVLQQGTQLGLFNGTQDMNDFKRKFKDITDSVKTITRFLHQTLEDGMKTIRDLRAIGVDPSQAGTFALQADVLGRVAGRTGSEMLGIGLQGAELFRGTGVNMGMGAQATMMNLSSIRAARDAGVLSQEAIVQAGGEEAFAMRETATSLAFAQSSTGRGFGAAFFNAGAGPGGFNRDAFTAAAMQGGMSLPGIAGMAAGNLASPAAVIAYTARQEQFVSEQGKMFGGRGLEVGAALTDMAIARFTAANTGASMEDSLRYAMKQRGVSPEEIEANIAKMRGAKEIAAKTDASISATYRKQKMDESFRGSWVGRAAQFIRNVEDPDKHIIDDFIARRASAVYDTAAEAATRFREETLFGTQTFHAAGGGFGGVTIGGARHLTGTGPVNLDVGIFQSVGANIITDLTAGGGAMAKEFGAHVTTKKKKDVQPGDMILQDAADPDGTVKTMSRAEYEGITKKLQSGTMSHEDAVLNLRKGDAEWVKKKAHDLIASSKGAVYNTGTLEAALQTDKRFTEITGKGAAERKEALLSELSTELGIDNTRHLKLFGDFYAGSQAGLIGDAKDAQRRVEALQKDIANKAYGAHISNESLGWIEDVKVLRERLHGTMTKKERTKTEAELYTAEETAIESMRKDEANKGKTKLDLGYVRERIIGSGVLNDKNIGSAIMTMQEGAKATSSVSNAPTAGMPTAEQIQKTQLDINTQILSIMTSLADRLGASTTMSWNDLFKSKAPDKVAVSTTANAMQVAASNLQTLSGLEALAKRLAANNDYDMWNESNLEQLRREGGGL